MSARLGPVLTALLVASAGNAQEPTQCDDNNWWGWRGGRSAHVCEIRDLTLPSTGALSVDADQNGSISVTGENRRDLQVRARVQAWGDDEAEAERIAGEVVVRSDGVLRAEGPEQRGRSGWSVNYEVLAPRRNRPHPRNPQRRDSGCQRPRRARVRSAQWRNPHRQRGRQRARPHDERRCRCDPRRRHVGRARASTSGPRTAAFGCVFRTTTPRVSKPAPSTAASTSTFP